MNLGTLSYGSAGTGFLLLALLLLAGLQATRLGSSLILVSTVTAAWAFVLAIASSVPIPPQLVYGAEMARGSLWILTLTLVGKGAIPRPLAYFSYILVFCLLTAFGVSVLTSDSASLDPALVMSRAGLGFAVLGLVLLEQMYRNAEGQARAALVAFLLGVGGVFAYDLFMYSQAELIQGIEKNAWQARGFVNALSAPLIALAVRRNPQWSLSIFVSRHVVFHTTAMFGMGGYLLLMALGGYYVRSIGGTWGGIAEILFMVVALGALTSLTFSGQLRRRLSVFIAKHFYRNKYDYRIEWLRFIRTLSANDEGDVKRTALRAVTQIFDSPGGVLLTADDAGRPFTPAAAWPFGLESMARMEDIHPDDELVGFLVRRQWIIDIEEYDRAPEVYDNIRLPDWIRTIPGLRIVSPMIELERLTGIFLLSSPPRPFRLTYEDRDLLKTVGQHVATQVAQHEADRKLAEVRQFEAYNKLTAFMMHDLKNCIAQLQLVVTNAERHKSNPDFIDDAISTTANAVARMTRLVEHLQQKSARPALQSVSLGALIDSAIRRCSDRQPVPMYSSADTNVTVAADPERLEAILEHVIRNAQDASSPEQCVVVELDVKQNEVAVIVRDNGSGMSASFIRERLFRPFDSTKGSKGMGIGAYQTREYVRMLGGDVEVQSSTGKGTQFSIRLPRSSAPVPAFAATEIPETQIVD